MANAPPAPSPNDCIVFLGDTEKKYCDREKDIPDHHFTQVKLDGDQSVYYVYPEINMGGHSPPSVPAQVVTSTCYEGLTLKPPKSCKGFSKEGIILFETFKYGGNSQNFNGTGLVTETFPTDESAGVSSFHVIDGTWELLGKDHGNIVVNGQTKFGPGYRSDMPCPSDKVASIKRV